MQTADNTPFELPREAAVSSPSPTQGGSLYFSLVSDQDADVESDVEEPSTSAIQPRQGLRPRQTPDRYASVRSVRSVPRLFTDLPFSTPMLLGLLLAASCPDVKPAVVAQVWTGTWVSIPILLNAKDSLLYAKYYLYLMKLKEELPNFKVFLDMKNVMNVKIC